MEKSDFFTKGQNAIFKICEIKGGIKALIDISEGYTGGDDLSASDIYYQSYINFMVKQLKELLNDCDTSIGYLDERNKHDCKI